MVVSSRTNAWCVNWSAQWLEVSNIFKIDPIWFRVFKAASMFHRNFNHLQSHVIFGWRSFHSSKTNTYPINSTQLTPVQHSPFCPNVRTCRTERRRPDKKVDFFSPRGSKRRSQSPQQQVVFSSIHGPKVLVNPPAVVTNKRLFFVLEKFAYSIILEQILKRKWAMIYFLTFYL